MSHPQPGAGGEASLNQPLSEKYPREVQPVANVGSWKACWGWCGAPLGFLTLGRQAVVLDGFLEAVCHDLT